MAAAFSRDRPVVMTRPSLAAPSTPNHPASAAHVPVGSLARRAPDDDWASDVELEAKVKTAPIPKTRLPSGLKLGKGTSPTVALPPSLNLSANVRHTARFKVTTTGSYLITNEMILASLGGIGSSTTSVASWASAFKMDSVTVWPSPSLSAEDSTSLSWSVGTAFQTPDEVLDLSLPEGVTVTRAIRFVPPKGSLAAFWLNDQTTTDVMLIKLVAGSVVDLNVNYRLSAAFGANSVTVATAVAGAVYYLALDGPSSNKVVPVSLPTTS